MSALARTSLRELVTETLPASLSLKVLSLSKERPAFAPVLILVLMLRCLRLESGDCSLALALRDVGLDAYGAGRLIHGIPDVDLAGDEMLLACSPWVLATSGISWVSRTWMVVSGSTFSNWGMIFCALSSSKLTPSPSCIPKKVFTLVMMESVVSCLFIFTRNGSRAWL